LGEVQEEYFFGTGHDAQSCLMQAKEFSKSCLAKLGASWALNADKHTCTNMYFMYIYMIYAYKYIYILNVLYTYIYNMYYACIYTVHICVKYIYNIYNTFGVTLCYLNIDLDPTGK
jgi:hypothetical protein